MKVKVNGRIIHVVPCRKHVEQVEAGFLVVSCRRCVLHAAVNCSGECDA